MTSATEAVVQGLKLKKKSSWNFVTRYENLVAISQISVAVYCVARGLTKQDMSPQYLCVKKPLKMVNERGNGVVHIISQLSYASIINIVSHIFKLKENSW